jgi:hypothetical protein
VIITPEVIWAARDYDISHRPPGNWQAVPADQVARLLEGAEPLIRADAEASRLATARYLAARAERDRLRLKDVPPQRVILKGEDGGDVQAEIRCGLLYLTGEAP